MKRPRRLRHGEEATLVEHLDELRTRLIIAIGSVVLVFVVTYTFRGHLLEWLNRPLPAARRKPVTFGVAEPFLTSLMVSLYAAVLVAVPVLFWQIWAFLAPALEESHQRVVAGFVAFATFLMICGVAFGYFLVLPAAVHFLTNYDSSHYTILIRARDYYSFTSLVMLAVALVFELPIFVLALVRLGILSTRSLRRNRRIGYVIVFAIAVALPGIDPVTTTIEGVPLMALYELSIWLAVIMERRWERTREPLTAEL